jgi:hypothetical protein
MASWLPALESQQAKLVSDSELAVRAQAVRRHDPVARHEDREPVSRAKRPGRTGRSGAPSERRELAIGHRLAARDSSQRGGKGVLKWSQLFEVELDVVEQDRLATEVGLEPLDQGMSYVVVPWRADAGMLVPDDGGAVQPQLAGTPSRHRVAERPDAHPEAESTIAP